MERRVSTRTQSKAWYGLQELAAQCGCSVDKVEEMARRHHWPRIHGENGSRIGVDIAIARRVLGSTTASVHGSVSNGT